MIWVYGYDGVELLCNVGGVAAFIGSLWMVVLDLESQWRCSGSSFIGSRQMGFWRSLKEFTVCFCFFQFYGNFGYFEDKMVMGSVLSNFIPSN